MQPYDGPVFHIGGIGTELLVVHQQQSRSSSQTEIMGHFGPVHAYMQQQICCN